MNSRARGILGTGSRRDGSVNCALVSSLSGATNAFQRLPCTRELSPLCQLQSPGQFRFGHGTTSRGVGEQHSWREHEQFPCSYLLFHVACCAGLGNFLETQETCSSESAFHDFGDNSHQATPAPELDVQSDSVQTPESSCYGSTCDINAKHGQCPRGESNVLASSASSGSEFPSESSSMSSPLSLSASVWMASRRCLCLTQKAVGAEPLTMARHRLPRCVARNDSHGALACPPTLVCTHFRQPANVCTEQRLLCRCPTLWQHPMTRPLSAALRSSCPPGQDGTLTHTNTSQPITGVSQRIHTNGGALFKTESASLINVDINVLGFLGTGTSVADHVHSMFTRSRDGALRVLAFF